jgi:hypothetical protein
MNASPAAVQAFIEGLRTGDWQDVRQHYAPDAIFDGTVPRWHFALRGVDTVVEELGRWFPRAACLTHLNTVETIDGAVVEFERRWQRPLPEGGSESVGIRQMHILHLDERGRIVEQHGHCAGIWDDATFATIEAEAPKI